MDTKDILFICGGAFVGLEEILLKKAGKKAMGFNAELTNQGKEKAKLADAEHTDIINYGFIPEFIGRLPIIATLEEINEEGLVTILSQPKNALVKQYQKLFALEGVELIFTEDALREVAKMALSRKSGARGLRSVLEHAMLDIMYSVPFLDDIESCTITKDVIQGIGDANLCFRQKKQTA